MAKHLAPRSTTDPAALTPRASLPVQRLRADAGRYLSDPFLLSVTTSGAPHASVVSVAWTGDQVVVPAPRHWTDPTPPASSKAGAARPVSLLYPPATASGYALIIDGTAVASGPNLTVTITRAVLYRRSSLWDAEQGPGCGSDCIPLILD